MMAATTPRWKKVKSSIESAACSGYLHIASTCPLAKTLIRTGVLGQPSPDQSEISVTVPRKSRGKLKNCRCTCPSYDVECEVPVSLELNQVSYIHHCYPLAFKEQQDGMPRMPRMKNGRCN
ncbi:hypothetical protein IF1G_04564 [Cordyceps javanica]|uniref:Uncharacterized protein n=1 Tax=Cordyceps javanica TaxID=43265 RepID=A0A545V6J7_9HYPO|nr:hypothetical protein IF1G_04564 [Cordyceps javanica]